MSEFTETVNHVFVNYINTPIAVALGFAAYAYIMDQTEKRKALSNNVFPGSQAVFSTVLYEPTGVLNPDTGNEFYRQRIVTLKGAMDLGEMFHHSIRASAMETMRKVSLACDQEKNSPTVFKTLYDSGILDDQELAIYRQVLRRSLRNHFSQIMDPNNNALKVLGPRERHVFEDYYLAMEAERLSRNRQLRIIAIPKALRDRERFPDFEDVIFINQDGTETRDAENFYAQRWHTIKKFLDELDEDIRLEEDSAIYVATGLVETIDAPTLSGNQ